ncbi:hypothetical protein ANME2D_02323 [Candidatus Methanoperedens nitroreducens]|uniref:Uncharacterized protein n=1 Tax=Candidatus Methanoperedens nitratireducens TaxID=1392998 RepID=A0A062V4R0_9EURY|nr:hypothetical protein ANME2D_02323 [Candidatus Methanoperedens nitroreducens]
MQIRIIRDEKDLENLAKILAATAFVALVLAFVFGM